MDKERMYIEAIEEISKVTGIDDVGYHTVIDGKLVPRYKRASGQLEDEKWKEIHGKNSVYVKDNPVLLEVIEQQKTVVINDTDKDQRSAEVFGQFNIKSIMVIPVKGSKSIENIIVVASIGKLHDFTEEDRIFSEKIVDRLSC
ncbi:GAF domain-containing protein [Alkaliphilus crotonatoxidans]